MAGESADRSARRMRDKAARLSLAADRWERGAEGERQTALALDALPPGEWTALHDVRWPGRQRANIDHVLVGPSGVFVIDSKNWSGTVAIEGGVLRQNGQRREREALAVVEAARAVARLVPTFPDHVRPVMCFVGSPVVGGSGAHGALLCSVHDLATTLAAPPQVLTPEHRQMLARHLEYALSVSGDARRAAPTTYRPLVPRATRRRKLEQGLAARLIGIVAAISLLGVTFTHPEVYEKFGDAFVGLVADTHEQPTQDPAEKPAKHRPKSDVVEKGRKGQH